MRPDRDEEGAPGDMESEIEPAHLTPEPDPISDSVSTESGGSPRNGLPDFLAMLRAEIAAAKATNAAGSAPPPSSLGAGEIVLAARERTGYSQRRLASALRSSQPSIAAIESGHRVPTVRTLIRVAEATGLELVVGLRSPGAAEPFTLGALIANVDDGLADYVPMRTPSPFEGPPDR
jgi:transcriptional regulator with XRE-family HTH domain